MNYQTPSFVGKRLVYGAITDEQLNELFQEVQKVDAANNEIYKNAMNHHKYIIALASDFYGKKSAQVASLNKARIQKAPAFILDFQKINKAVIKARAVNLANLQAKERRDQITAKANATREQNRQYELERQEYVNATNSSD